MRFSILKKFLFAFLILSLAPLLLLSFYASQTLIQVGHNTVESTKQALVQNSASLLEARARGIARQVELFLKLCKDDLNSLSLIPFDADLYLRFSKGHERQIWIRQGNPNNIQEIKKSIPLYREITYVDIDGVEKIRILENKIFPGGRHVSVPFWGSFGREDYFNHAHKLSSGETYVSHLMGVHVRKYEQLQGVDNVENAVGGALYKGIIRFAAPVFKQKKFAGVVSLALDHQHLMEYTQHVLPVGNREVVFPSYSSGNYAFLFDDEGWIITHPKLWDIRGYDQDTRLLADPNSPDYNKASMQEGLIPFNLFHVPFIHKNYKHIAMSVLEGKSGITTTSSVGEVSRVMAYAPIRFNSGEFKKTGFFGGVTLGARTETFHSSIEETASGLHNTVNRTVLDFIFIILGTAVIVGIIAIFIAKSFSNPIRLLIEKVTAVSAGHFDVSVDIHSGDELEALGSNFQAMGHQLEKHRQKLVSSLKELELSKKEAVKERDFIKSVFSKMVNGLIVVNKHGIITSVNNNTKIILGLTDKNIEGQPVDKALKNYPDLLEYILNAFAGKETFGLDLELKSDGPRKYIEITVSRLEDASLPSDQSIMTVLRDISKRKKMERYLSRADRLVSLGTLAAGVAHEIRNPLTGISLLLDDLHDRMTQQPEDQILMQKALTEIEKLEKIITELLEFASQPTTKYVVTDINKVIENTIFLIKKQCKQQKVFLFRNHVDKVPPFCMDSEKMKQAFLNILLNALNVMQNGGELHIDTYLQKNLEILTTSQCIEIRICDTGPGVNPDDMDYIFDPFFTKTPKGSGLGLSITHTIIEEHKGKILVDSKLGRGACFKVFFPIAEEKNGKNSGS